MKLRSRVVPGVLIGGLVIAGGGSVLAASGGSSSVQSSAQEQYCPPNSPGSGQPQGGPGNNCGNPPDNCPNGQPKPPSGNCGNGNGGNGGPPEKCPNGNPKPPGGNCGKTSSGPAEKEAKAARFRVRRKAAKHCYSRRFTLAVSVANAGTGRKVQILRDGHRIKATGRRKFNVSVNVRRLKPGVHRLQLRVKGADGKWRTRTVKFRRC